MKKFSLFMAATLFFMIGCSSDEYNTELNQESSKLILKKENTNYIVSVNGEIVNQYMSQYAGGEYSKYEVFENVTMISRSNLDYRVLEGSGTAYVDEVKIDASLNSPESYVASLPFSSVATQKVMSFLSQKVSYDDDTVLLIQVFTDSIRANTDLDENEKNIIMRAAQLSLCKYNIDGEDPEWNKTRTVVASALSGGLDSPAQAVLNAAVVTALTL